MNTYRKQSRKPKPLPAEQQVELFKRGMKELGYDVDVHRGSGRYSPALTVSLWPKRKEKAS